MTRFFMISMSPWVSACIAVAVFSYSTEYSNAVAAGSLASVTHEAHFADADPTESDIHTQLRTDRLAFVAWCIEAGLMEEARRELDALHPKDDQTSKLAEQIDPAKSVEPTGQTWGEFMQRKGEAGRKAATALVALANACGDDDKRRDGLLRQAQTLDADNSALHTARGHRLIEGFGWYSAQDYASLAPRIIALTDAKAPQGKGPLLLQTDHYSILSDLDLRSTKDAGKHAELLHQACRDVLGTHVPPPMTRLGIRLFRDTKSYSEAVVAVGLGPEFGKLSGAFIHGSNLVYICEPNGRNAGGTLRTLSHEGTHQFITAGMCGSPQLTGQWGRAFGESSGAWIVESIAVSFESLVAKKDGYALPFGADKFRQPWVYWRSAQKKLDPLATFLKLNRNEWGACSAEQLVRRYAMGGELAHLCLHGGNADDAKALKAYLSRYYRGKGNSEDFKAQFGTSWERFEMAWQDHLLAIQIKK